MSAFGPKRTSPPHMSAFEGKADMTFCGANALDEALAWVAIISE